MATTIITKDVIRQTRKTLGMTQEQFATRLGLSQGTVALWESGERNPSGSATILLEMLVSEAERAAAKK